MILIRMGSGSGTGMGNLEDTSMRVPWVAAAAGLLGVIIINPSVGQETKPAGEPLFEGKPIGHWIKVLESGDAKVRGQAGQAIGTLVALAKENANADVVAQAKSALPSLVKALQDKEESVRDWAAYTVGYLGPDAKSALPSLVKLLKDKDQLVTMSAANALGSMRAEGKDAVPALVEAATGDDPWLRFSAVEALGKIGSAEKDAIGALVKGVYDREYIVRKGSTEALGRLGPAAKQAVPTLIKAIEDELQYDNIRKAAADSLKKIDPEAAVKAGIR